MIESLIIQTAFGFIGTAGFAILFSVPRRALLLSAGVGALGTALRAIVLGAGAFAELATFCGALGVGIVGYIACYLVEAPRLVYTVPGVLTMVPGVAAFGIILQFSAGKYSDGLVRRCAPR